MEQTRTPPAARMPRSNADYRWTLPKAVAFLEALAECGKVAEAARRVGMSRRSAYRLRARLASGPLGAGFELARRKGLAARTQRPESRWEGPGLDQVALPRQGHAPAGQGHAFPLQSYAMDAKVTQSGPRSRFHA